MFLTITSTAPTATDLGFLLHKHPARVQSFGVSVGQVHVFYPEATPQRCTAALLLEVDPVALVRGRGAGGPDGFALAQYVNDRPYAASSMLAVALGRVFRTAMAGRCDARPELPGQALPLEVNIPALPCVGGVEMAQRVFGPLGWSVDAQPLPLDPQIPRWGESRYLTVRLTGQLRLAEALNHLYVLLPVLDNSKHYWVSIDEVDKLVRAGQGWLHGHPDRDMIVRRYLAHKRTLVTTAVGRLAEVDDTEPQALDNAVPDEELAEAAEPAEVAERALALVEQRHGCVLAALRAAGAARVLDLGCGGGALLRVLAADPSFREVVGVDVSARALEIAARRLRLARMSDRQRERIRLVQSSLTYRDARLAGFDAVVLMEVIEHVDPPRLPALERTVFAPNSRGAQRPPPPSRGTGLGSTRSGDRGDAGRPRAGPGSGRCTRRSASSAQPWPAAHRRYLPVGFDAPEVGPPTQLAVFTRAETSGAAR